MLIGTDRSPFLWIKIKNLFQVGFTKRIRSSLGREKICWKTYFEFLFLVDHSMQSSTTISLNSIPELTIVMNIEIVNFIPDTTVTYPISDFHFRMKRWAHIWYFREVRCLNFYLSLYVNEIVKIETLHGVSSGVLNISSGILLIRKLKNSLTIRPPSSNITSNLNQPMKSNCSIKSAKPERHSNFLVAIIMVNWVIDFYIVSFILMRMPIINMHFSSPSPCWTISFIWFMSL